MGIRMCLTMRRKLWRNYPGSEKAGRRYMEWWAGLGEWHFIVFVR